MVSGVVVEATDSPRPQAGVGCHRRFSAELAGVSAQMRSNECTYESTASRYAGS